MFGWLWITVASLVAAVAIGGGVIYWIGRRRRPSLEQARKTFHLRREWLEANFLSRAAASGMPRGLRWADCEFEDTVAYARDRQTGRIRALVGVTILFEAVAGGGMEEVEAVGNLKAATVVFRLDGPEWEADGRAFFNLNPTQTIQHYHQELETAE